MGHASRSGHRSRSLCAFVVLVSAAAAGCSPSPQVDNRAITTHVSSSCAFTSNSVAIFSAVGDFDLSGILSTGVMLSDVGAIVPTIPTSTAELVLNVTDLSTSTQWTGLGPVSTAGDISVLAWPQGTFCPLPADIGSRQNYTLGAVDPWHLLVVGGETGGAVANTLFVSLTTGVIAPLTLGLLTPRLSPSVTAFTGGVFVAGGTSVDTLLPLASAEVYVSGAGGGAGAFNPTPIVLSEPRARHGAVVLASGATLLVGGASSTGAPLRSLEILDPVSHRAQTAGLVELQVARIAPSVSRLASGELLVAGGTDASGATVQTLEWITADATAFAFASTTLAIPSQYGFVPLPAGGALAVFAPDPTSPVPFQNVWVIRADGTLEAATSVSLAPTEVRLFAGAAGAPVLWTGDRWLEWQPWTGAFGAFAAGAPTTEVGSSAISPDPGLVVWTTSQGAQNQLGGFRFSTRNPYVTRSDPFLKSDTNYVAPDRLILPEVTTSVQFDPATGLTLAPGASVVLTDATYANVTVQFEAPTGILPSFVLSDGTGGQFNVGGSDCPWMDALNADSNVTVVRIGTQVSVTIDDNPEYTCTMPFAADTRLTLGFAAKDQLIPSSTVRAVLVRRSP